MDMSTGRAIPNQLEAINPHLSAEAVEDWKEINGPEEFFLDINCPVCGSLKVPRINLSGRISLPGHTSFKVRVISQNSSHSSINVIHRPDWSLSPGNGESMRPKLGEWSTNSWYGNVMAH